MRIFLSGPMGVGKSTIARLVADELGLDAIDLDAEIVAEAGMDIPAIFAAEGEGGFRAREAAAAARWTVADDVVVALGGGTVTSDVTRRAMLRAGVLVTLAAPIEVLAARVSGGQGRPLLDGDPAGRLRALVAARAAAYAECHGVVDATGEPTQVADAVVALARDVRVAVPLGTRSYAVEIGAGVRWRLHERIARHALALFVADENTAMYARPLLRPSDRLVVLTPGEEHKDVRAVERIWDAGLEAGVDRDACVVAVGGGVVGDLAGFAAATLLRGIAFGQVPTSLLAMVDSSVGGKTGFDRPQGKNLVGAFHQPDFVLCDVETLDTLAREERIAGLAEVVKSAWIEGEADVAALEEDADALREGEVEATLGAIRRSVATKARVVEADEREAGMRMLLNLGHTIGHAVEAAGGYGTLRHGEAVSLGMVAAARVGRALGDLSAADEARLLALLARLGLPVDLGAHLDEASFAYVGSDKKRVGGDVRFVVPGAPGGCRMQRLALDELARILGLR
ncbi:MAG: 3-dehydroquinate synthase [Myxococcales bacterium]|nr:3-dehydroquinate synthase [Myxococcales bacterium]